MWFQETEGAKFWMQVLSELKQRGVTDILIACVDGLKAFPEAIEAIFPQTTVQTCIVHYADIRNMPMWLAKPSGGGRLRAVGVGIIRALRET
jgi:putative transposase